MKKTLKLLIIIASILFVLANPFAAQQVFSKFPSKVLETSRALILKSDKSIEYDSGGGLYRITFIGEDETGPYTDKITLDREGKFVAILSPSPVPQRIYKRLERIVFHRSLPRQK